MIHSTLAIRRVSINETHHSKTLHLVVDTGASMSVMATSVVRELGIMHIVAGHETYKIAFSIVTHGVIEEDVMM